VAAIRLVDVAEGEDRGQFASRIHDRAIMTETEK
jgi:hypothetical protein